MPHPTTRIFEDGQTPLPKQKKFPHRRQSVNRRTPASAPPVARWKQQTLTQITPSLYQSSSFYTSFDGADDLEDENHDVIVPPKKKRRKSSKQSSDKQTPDQQTITQMDPFKRQASPDHELTDLGQDDIPIAKTPPRRKKRAAKSTTPVVSIIQTRSGKKRAAEASADTKVVEGSAVMNQQSATSDHKSPSCQAKSTTTLMPPPQTPQTVRRKVIPSSQSPAETPLSSQRPRDKDTKTPTPLKERSVNTPSKSRLRNRRTSVRLKPKLEVANSTGIENEDSQFIPPIKFQGSEGVQPVEEHPSTQPQSTLYPSQAVTPTHGQKTYDYSAISPSNVVRRGGVSKLSRKRTISDSNEEETAQSLQSINPSTESPHRKFDLQSFSVINTIDPHSQQILSSEHHDTI
ncbi:MAG: hypothetical protein Q9222_006261, partial [Ikaeria aurantiellina]